jgi:hypothetical protein
MENKEIYKRMFGWCLEDAFAPKTPTKKQKKHQQKRRYKNMTDSYILDMAMDRMDKRIARCGALVTAKDVRKFVKEQRSIADDVEEELRNKVASIKRKMK